MTIDIICPLYNAEKYLKNLNNYLQMQKNVNINNINYILTESVDHTEDILKEQNCNYIKIKKEDFSHSLTRENAAMKSNADIIVFVTQDVVIEDLYWLYYLVKDLGKNNIVASYSRQISKYNSIEKYTREYNYPSNSKIVSIKDISELGLKTFFFSDASGAILTSIFKKLNGYDQKNLPISEDMYLAYKIITNGYKIKYCADSIVYHSHKFKFKQMYNRYKLTGQFFKENNYLNSFNVTKSGSNLAKYVLKRIIQEHRLALLFKYPLDMASRYFGMRAGEK
ncbi:MAG: glycosyltransferase family 2 protein [Bacilli bacterium]|nr:glycosyltransferase family 2 protein [Bacilli bacterium]